MLCAIIKRSYVWMHVVMYKLLAHNMMKPLCGFGHVPLVTFMYANICRCEVHVRKVRLYHARRLTGTYVHTMGVIISRDISRFTAIFLAFLIVFSGSFYLSLRYDTSAVIFDGNGTLVSGGGINSDQRSLDGEGSLLHEVYFTGLRSLLESGSVLTYFESGGGFR